MIWKIKMFRVLRNSGGNYVIQMRGLLVFNWVNADTRHYRSRERANAVLALIN
jgi:hypothetical protein